MLSVSTARRFFNSTPRVGSAPPHQFFSCHYVMASFSNDDFMHIAIFAAAFIIISSPRVYELTGKFAPSGWQFTKPGAQPTPVGLVVHSLVFVAVLLAVGKLAPTPGRLY